ncbi:Cytochrome P450 4C1 [Frankliniella fusca]|uniref:Cytochrome P450 4C1 n=1 Tax=Frankliniella fusca TaxID=407009 RepID=A0AAE1LIN4_9NEOP|nr:Cytochrome P450 4C1 [Frankliniella fusca]
MSEANSQEIVEKLDRIVMNVNQRSFNPLLWPDWIYKRTQMYQEEIEFEGKVSKLIERIVHRKTTEINRSATWRQSAKLGCKDKKSLLDMLVERKLMGELDMTAEDILTETVTMFGTAIHTPPLTVSFILKVLSLRPDIQERVYTEICDVFHEEQKEWSYDDLSRLQYMDRVINETLRMFPVGPFILREVKKDMKIDNKHIPAGTILMLNIMGVHRSDRYHKDPLHFDPDRFLPERAGDIHPYSFLPFSSGPRNCIGQPLGWMMVKTLLVTTLRAFEIFPVADGVTDPSQFEINMDLMIHYVGGAKVRLVPRKASLLAAREANANDIYYTILCVL